MKKRKMYWHQSCSLFSVFSQNFFILSFSRLNFSAFMKENFYFYKNIRAIAQYLKYLYNNYIILTPIFYRSSLLGIQPVVVDTRHYRMILFPKPHGHTQQLDYWLKYQLQKFNWIFYVFFESKRSISVCLSCKEHFWFLIFNE